MRILFLSPYVPSLIRVRPYNWIKFLHDAGHEITLLTLIGGADDETALPQMETVCHKVIPVQLPRWRPPLNALLALVRTDPLQLAYSRLPTMNKQIAKVMASKRFDVAHIEHLRGACFAPALRPLPIVYDAVDSISLLFERTIAHNPQITSKLLARLDLGRTRRFEGRVHHRFNRILVTSPEDTAQFHRLSNYQIPDEILVTLPNGVDLDYFALTGRERKPNVLLFSGKLSYHANVAAVLYLHREIMPQIWAKRPDVKLWLVGKDPIPAIQDLAADERITVTGFVPDIRPYLAQATISVSPMPYGVGIQNKVLEAMASGIPVITTEQTCKALDVEPGRHLLVSTSPADFAEKVLGLLAAPSQQQHLAAAARQYVETRHNWQALTTRLTDVYREAQVAQRKNPVPH